MSEPRRTKTKLPWLWPAVGVMLALIWAGFLFFHGPDWYSVLIGFVTGGLFIAFAGEVAEEEQERSLPARNPGERSPD